MENKEEFTPEQEVQELGQDAEYTDIPMEPVTYEPAFPTSPHAVHGELDALIAAAPPRLEAPRTHSIIEAAQQVLGDAGSTERSISNVGPYKMPEAFNPTPPPMDLSSFQMFPDVTEKLRSEEGVDLYRVKRLNLAAAVETLERAVKSHEAFPSADAGIAVAKLSEQVSQLVKDIEKAQDPYDLYSRIVETAMEPLTSDIIKNLAEESKWLIAQFENHVPEAKRVAFRETVKTAVMRVGPSLKESLDNAKERLLTSLNIKVNKK